MNNIYSIIEELNENNGSNHKKEVLLRHKDNELLKRVLKMTYDKATFTYGITLKNVDHPGFERESTYKRSLSEVLDYLENEFVTRNITGNNALDVMSELLFSLSIDDRRVLHGIINRDLRINMGRSNINKVFPDLIVKPAYMRCGMYNEKTSKKFNAKGAFVQLKADGTYREFNVDGGEVSCVSRSGEIYDYPFINEVLIAANYEGVFFGELTVYRDGKLLDRSTGNGLLKKDDFPEDCTIVLDLWDVVSHKEYANAKKKVKDGCVTPYVDRWNKLNELFPDHTADYTTNPVRCIESIEVDTISEALSFTSTVMNMGLEGSIIKERNAVFKDGTSAQQLKLKVAIQLEVRVSGFHEGKVGTVRELTFGSAIFETDDGLIKGKVSGFTNEQLEDFNSRREEIIGNVWTVECNDITRARDSDTWALSHPRFIEERNDKTETDTFDSAMETKEMALTIGNTM